MYRYTIKQTNEIELIHKWDQFVLKNNGSYFQSSSYYSFCNLIHGYEPHLILSFSEGRIVGGILMTLIVSGSGMKQFFSRRIIIIGGPVIEGSNTDSERIIEELLQFLNKNFSKNSLYTEFRNLNDLDSSKLTFTRHHFRYTNHLNYRVLLDHEESVKKKMSKSKLRQINKSLKTGAVIKYAEKESEIQDFYRILVNLYKQKVKKPLPDYQFFQKFFFLSQQDLNYRIFLIHFNNQIIGGMVAPIYNGIIYEWYICGLDGTFKNIYPSVLATWAAIKYGLENKLKYFDFLGAGKPDADYGVREFKARFGGEMVNYGRFLKINNSLLYYLGRFGLQILKKLRRV